MLRRMGKSKAEGRHTPTYFRKRRVSIQLDCIRNPELAGVSSGSRGNDSASRPCRRRYALPFFSGSAAGRRFLGGIVQSQFV